MLVGEGGSGVALQILTLLNFINIAERRSFSATSPNAEVLELIFIHSLLPSGQKNTGANGYLKQTISLYLSLLLH